ncbi:MAG TPA: OmpA family protein [Chthoniobacter sp.]|jgi:outer membrane protein OmpA-like peptidoglycan-associated protein
MNRNEKISLAGIFLGALISSIAPVAWWLGTISAMAGLIWIFAQGREAPMVKALAIFFAAVALIIEGCSAYMTFTYRRFEANLVTTSGAPSARTEVLVVDTQAALPIAQSVFTDNSGEFSYPKLRKHPQRFIALRGEGEKMLYFEFTRDLSAPPEQHVEIRGFPDHSDVVSTATPIYFESDESQLDESSRRVAGSVLAGLPSSDGTLIIEGHTDERGRDDYNYDLGRLRAITVYEIAKSQGFSDVVMVSYGRSRPVETGPMRQDRKNRRVVVRFIPKDGGPKKYVLMKETQALPRFMNEFCSTGFFGLNFGSNQLLALHNVGRPNGASGSCI